ncbi:hypothetical protein QE407_000760 [Pantoea dispersa]|nr:hypothetical protein [Pantoea dispersa]
MTNKPKPHTNRGLVAEIVIHSSSCNAEELNQHLSDGKERAVLLKQLKAYHQHQSERFARWQASGYRHD